MSHHRVPFGIQVHFVENIGPKLGFSVLHSRYLSSETEKNCTTSGKDLRMVPLLVPSDKVGQDKLINLNSSF